MMTVVTVVVVMVIVCWQQPRHLLPGKRKREGLEAEDDDDEDEEEDRRRSDDDDDDDEDAVGRPLRMMLEMAIMMVMMENTSPRASRHQPRWWFRSSWFVHRNSTGVSVLLFSVRCCALLTTSHARFRPNKHSRLASMHACGGVGKQA
jgi:hypothetical protein